MISTYKVLGQSAPAATTAVDLYTVPALTSTIVSTITVCNRASAVAKLTALGLTEEALAIVGQ